MNVFFAALKCSELYFFKCSRCFNALFNGQCQIFRLAFRSPLEYRGATTLHCLTVETAFWCAMCCEVNQIRLSTSRIHDYEKIVTPAFPVGKCAVKWRTYFLHTHTYYEKSAAHSCFNTLTKFKWHIFFPSVIWINETASSSSVYCFIWMVFVASFFAAQTFKLTLSITVCKHVKIH